jgi:hypothetical protein
MGNTGADGLMPATQLMMSRRHKTRRRAARHPAQHQSPLLPMPAARLAARAPRQDCALAPQSEAPSGVARHPRGSNMLYVVGRAGSRPPRGQRTIRPIAAHTLSAIEQHYFEHPTHTDKQQSRIHAPSHPPIHPHAERDTHSSSSNGASDIDSPPRAGRGRAGTGAYARAAPRHLGKAE